MRRAGRLTLGGRLLLYTGSAIVDGRDDLRDALAAAIPDAGCTLDYRELDPDVFGEELERPEYAEVDRIAAITRRTSSGPPEATELAALAGWSLTVG